MKPLNNFAEFLSKKFLSAKNYLYKNYGENPGKMLVHTGVLGWVLSSAAQVTAVAFNDKISSKEKLFLIPQECADAAINILSFYAFTSSFKAIGSKLVSTGKLATPSIRKYIQKAGLTNDVGKISTDISKDMTGQVYTDYKAFKNGVDVLTSTVGSIISCNLITPVFRNQYAAKKQKEILAKHQSPATAQPLVTPQIHKPLSMADYQRQAAMRFGQGNLKI